MADSLVGATGIIVVVSPREVCFEQRRVVILVRIIEDQLAVFVVECSN